MQYNAILEATQVENSVTEPCTLAEAKEWCKIELDISEEDDLINSLITSARLQCEGFLCISLVDKVVTSILRNELGGIELPYGPVKNITSITNEDDIVLVNLDSYILQGNKFKTIKSPCDSYLVAVYTTGYDIVPNNFKTAVLQQVAFLYENRGDSAAGSQRLNNQTVPTQLSPMVTEILKPYRRVW